MAAAPFVLSIVAATFFLVIGLEELPLRINVHRVVRSVRRRARRRGRPETDVLDGMLRNTRRSVWILLGFAAASFLLAAWLVAQTPPDSPAWNALAPLHLFAATLVLGLLFLTYAFHAWAPRLMERVRAELSTASGSNPAGPFDRPGS